MQRPTVRCARPTIPRGAVPRLAAAALALVLAGAAPAAAQDERPALGLDYGLYVGGLQALDFSTRVELSQARYDIRFQARTDGFIARLFPFVMEARSRGVRADGRLRPQRYQTANRWGSDGDKRWVALDYPKGAGTGEVVPVVAAQPLSEQDDRAIVPQPARQATVDPISAIYGLVINAEAGCGGRREIFDGRRRYNIVAEDRGNATLEPSDYAVYDGPARLCRLTVEMVEGFWTKYDMKDRYPDTIDVWMARVADGLPPLPVRLEAETMLGGLRVHLTGVRRGAAADLPASGLFPLAEAKTD